MTDNRILLAIMEFLRENCEVGDKIFAAGIPPEPNNLVATYGHLVASLIVYSGDIRTKIRCADDHILIVHTTNTSDEIFDKISYTDPDLLSKIKTRVICPTRPTPAIWTYDI